MKRAAAQNQVPVLNGQRLKATSLQGERSLSADNFRSPAFFRSKSAAPTTYIEENGAKSKGYLRSTVSGTISYIHTGREAEIAARVARILLKGENHEA